MSFASKDNAEHPDGVYLRSAPTDGKWSLTKMLLLPDQHVRVSLRLTLGGGTEWLKVSKLGGMEGWVPADYVILESPDSQQNHIGEMNVQKDVTYCSVPVGKKSSWSFQGGFLQHANPQGA
jgi:hypothetical protein